MDEESRKNMIRGLMMTGMSQDEAEIFIEKQEAKQEILKGWKPICLYDPEKYDWVLIKFFDGDFEHIPTVAELRNDGIWYSREDAKIPYDIRYFFDMQLLDKI